MKVPLIATVLVSALCLAAGFGLGKFVSGSGEEAAAGAAGSDKSRAKIPAALQGKTVAAPAPAPPDIRRTLEGMTPAQVKEHTARVLREPDRMVRMAGLMCILAGMTPENASAINDAVNERHSTGADTGPEGGLIQIRTGFVLGAAAMAGMPAEPNGSPSWPVQSKMKGWATADPKAARAWLDALEPGQAKTVMERSWREGLAEAGPEALEGIFSSLSPSQQRGLTGRILTGVFDRGGTPGMIEWYQTTAAAPNADSGVKQEAFTKIMERLGQRSVEEAFTFIKNQAGTVDLNRISFDFFLDCTGQSGKCLELLHDLTKSAPQIEGRLDQMIDRTINQSSAKSLNVLAEWLNANRGHPVYDRAVQRFALRTNNDDPEAAARWADTIRDETLRTRTKEMLSGGASR
jgi:hypothetical protein